MLIINKKYAIKNDGLCYAICKPEKQKGTIQFIAKWYFNTLAQAVCFLTDRAIDIPSDLKILSDDIEAFKNDIKKSLKRAQLDTEATISDKDIPGIG